MKILLSIILFFAFSTASFAHPGRTDSSGGHNDNINGGYHYHNGGTAKPPKPRKKKKATTTGQAVTAESLSAGDKTSVVYQYDSDKYHEIIIPAGSFAILELQEGERSSRIIQSEAAALEINIIRTEGLSFIEKVYFSKLLADIGDETSVVIPTNKRIYHFRVIINGNYIPTNKVRFDYP